MFGATGVSGGTNGVFGYYATSGSKTVRDGYFSFNGANSWITTNGTSVTSAPSGTANFLTAGSYGLAAGNTGVGQFYIEPGANFVQNSFDTASISGRWIEL